MANIAPSADLRQQFGDIDIYLFDQVLRGRFDGRRRILDAGCGTGRNLRSLATAWSAVDPSRRFLLMDLTGHGNRYSGR